ncbi:hypothetical protein ACOME3_001549 [Neoechinorhynchus agilis]
MMTTDEFSKPPFEHLIIDTSGLINSIRFESICQKAYTTQSALNEVKNKQLRKRLATSALTCPIILREPSEESCAIVRAIARRSGEYRSLSKIDIELMALTYDIHVENGGLPFRAPSQPPISRGNALFRVIDPRKRCKSDWLDVCRVIDRLLSKVTIIVDGPPLNKSIGQDEWIGPSNLHMVHFIDDTRTTACLTTDFAMQNCLKQMGLGVTDGGSGKLIRHTSSYALRCPCCSTIIPEVDRRACWTCGATNLERICAKSNSSGKVYYILPKYPAKSKKPSCPINMPSTKCQGRSKPNNRKASRKENLFGRDAIYDNFDGSGVYGNNRFRK